MRRGILIALLSIGVIGGFASGIHRLRHGTHGPGWGPGGCGWRTGRAGLAGWQGNETFEEHVARICAEAARKEAAKGAPPATVAPQAAPEGQSPKAD